MLLKAGTRIHEGVRSIFASAFSKTARASAFLSAAANIEGVQVISFVQDAINRDSGSYARSIGE